MRVKLIYKLGRFKLIGLFALVASILMHPSIAIDSLTIDGYRWSVDDDLSYSVDIDNDGQDDHLQYLVRTNDSDLPSSMLTIRLAGDPPDVPSISYFLGDQTQIRAIDYEPADETLIVDVIEAVTHDVPIIKRIRLRFRRGKLRYVGEEVRPYDGWSALNGTTWMISSYDTLSDVEISVPITLTVEDHKVYGRSGCNNYRGDMVSDEKLGLSIDRISNTRKLCSQTNMEVEGWYLGALKQVSEFGFDSGRLVMKYACNTSGCQSLIFESMD